MTEPKLKPCPFCGGEARIDKLYENEWYVYCPQCERHYDTEKEAIEHWNKRAVIVNGKTICDLCAKRKTCIDKNKYYPVVKCPNYDNTNDIKVPTFTDRLKEIITKKHKEKRKAIKELLKYYF